MKITWAIILVSAVTDAIITFATGISASMATMDTVQLPNNAALVLAGLGAIVSFARTIQQALKKFEGGA